MLKRSLGLICAILGIMGAASLLDYAFHGKAWDQYLYGRAVKLFSDKGSCSGVQIKAKSGKEYILTAAHCDVLKEDGKIHVQTEDGRELYRQIIEVSKEIDLMILEGVPDLDGIDIAESDLMKEHVRSFTHGGGMDTYRTDGVLIQEMPVKVTLYAITSEAQKTECLSSPKREIDETFFGPICFMNYEQVATTAKIVPGSSGGMIVDDEGKLVGIVSAGGDDFGFLVPLHDILDFIKNY